MKSGSVFRALISAVVCCALLASAEGSDNFIQDGATDSGGKHMLLGSSELTVNGATAQVPWTISSGLAYSTSASKTRPNDTNAYTASDVIAESASAGTVWTFSSAGPSGGKAMITAVTLEIDVAAVPSGMSSFRLHLYNASPTAINDNAAYDLAAGDRTKYLGYITIPAPVDLGATLWAQDPTIRQQVKFASSSTTLYGIVETVGAYTPTAQAVHTIGLQVVKLAD